MRVIGGVERDDEREGEGDLRVTHMAVCLALASAGLERRERSLAYIELCMHACICVCM